VLGGGDGMAGQFSCTELEGKAYVAGPFGLLSFSPEEGWATLSAPPTAGGCPVVAARQHAGSGLLVAPQLGSPAPQLGRKRTRLALGCSTHSREGSPGRSDRHDWLRCHRQRVTTLELSHTHRTGDRCTACAHPFVRSFASFEPLPLVRFVPERRISQEEALSLVRREAPPRQAARKEEQAANPWSGGEAPDVQTLSLAGDVEQMAAHMDIDDPFTKASAAVMCTRMHMQGVYVYAFAHVLHMHVHAHTPPRRCSTSTPTRARTASSGHRRPIGRCCLRWSGATST